MSNEKIIENFYQSFSEGNAAGMTACYHKDVVFTDPAFGTLRGERAHKMWEMLLSNKKASAKTEFTNIQSTENEGSAEWVAEYNYGPKKRKVINRVSAQFEFKEGLIIKHTDSFDIWKWSKRALGLPGTLLGWTPFIKNKIQKTTAERLDAFMKQ